MKVTIVVSGNPRMMKFVADTPVSHLIPRALHETGNVLPIESEWELRDAEGFLLDRASSLFARVKEGAQLYLNPMAGIGG